MSNVVFHPNDHYLRLAIDLAEVNTFVYRQRIERRYDIEADKFYFNDFFNGCYKFMDVKRCYKSWLGV